VGVDRGFFFFDQGAAPALKWLKQDIARFKPRGRRVGGLRDETEQEYYILGKNIYKVSIIGDNITAVKQAPGFI
jgi:hypothetical protein